MDAEITYLKLKNTALQEFPDIVVSASITRGPLNVAKSLRLFFTDNSFMEIWITARNTLIIGRKQMERFSGMIMRRIRNTNT